MAPHSQFFRAGPVRAALRSARRMGDERGADGGAGRHDPGTGGRCGDAGGRRTADHRSRRRLLLGRAGRVSAHQGRDRGGLRLCRRDKQTAHYEMVGSGAPATPSWSRSPSIRSRFRSARSCRSISPSRTIRLSSTARDRMSARNIAPRSSLPMTNRSGSPSAYIAQLGKAHAFRRPIVTQLEQLSGFYPAEDYHQDFAVLHPSYPYIVFNDLPKVENLKHVFADFLSRHAGHGHGGDEDRATEVSCSRRAAERRQDTKAAPLSGRS